MINSLLDLSYFRMSGSRNCFGCCSKAPLIISVDEQPSKEIKVGGQKGKKTSMSMDFSTSTYDIDNSVPQSQRSMSFIGTSNPLPDLHTTTGCTSTTEFVNHGLSLWNQTRKQWVGKKGSHNRKGAKHKLSLNTSYESLLGTNKQFPNPIPLPQMIDFLVGVWEKEGLYD
ncbi:uncharacterized protein LOC124926263 [Impatiens glandulifera]|uniref:uncharacterized protein LOC124926263 n=1 Tax=Impatiens glandulifera TaxID=253017 RepID=UPI001FB111A4|nr:uncharacterized protein LOC124926263 [Impatiens glandulifera]